MPATFDMKLAPIFIIVFLSTLSIFSISKRIEIILYFNEMIAPCLKNHQSCPWALFNFAYNSTERLQILRKFKYSYTKIKKPKNCICALL